MSITAISRTMLEAITEAEQDWETLQALTGLPGPALFDRVKEILLNTRTLINVYKITGRLPNHDEALYIIRHGLNTYIEHYNALRERQKPTVSEILKRRP